MARLTSLLFFLIFICSCSKEGDFYFLSNKQADMPIWIRGNTSSNIFILHLHGGPGGSSIQEAEEGPYRFLEKDYAVVYWDQRASGASQGNPTPKTISMDQMVEDVEKVIAIIRHQYKSSAKIFLLGHSWGGALGTAYLIKGNNQLNIQGWIEQDGAHNFKKGLELSRQWAIDYAKQAIASKQDEAFWQEALKWYEQHPNLGTKKVLDVHTDNYLTKANGYIKDINNPNLARFTGGGITAPSGITNSGNYIQSILESELGKEYSSKMNIITIPSLILWGRHDGILPVALAKDAYDSQGTIPSKKSIVIFESSAHSPCREEPDAFATAVLKFIATYK